MADLHTKTIGIETSKGDKIFISLSSYRQIQLDEITELIGENWEHSPKFKVIQDDGRVFDDNNNLIEQGFFEAESVTESVTEKHSKLKSILIENNNQEYGDCIIDEICTLFDCPTTSEE